MNTRSFTDLIKAVSSEEGFEINDEVAQQLAFMAKEVDDLVNDMIEGDVPYRSIFHATVMEVAMRRQFLRDPHCQCGACTQQLSRLSGMVLDTLQHIPERRH